MHCIEFKKEEEVVSRASQMLQYCNGDSKSLSSTNELMLSLGNIYERNISQTVDSLTSRLQITETAISANLMDLTSILEVFLSSSFHVHVSCTSDFFMKASAVSQQISKALYTEPGELPVLDKKIHEEMNSLYKLLHLKPEK
ncbi:unnamed protein product [Trichobilharzia regenti]|nr:unnamed protein product [Trichobilharzia regenti]